MSFSKSQSPGTNYLIWENIRPSCQKSKVFLLFCPPSAHAQNWGIRQKFKNSVQILKCINGSESLIPLHHLMLKVLFSLLILLSLVGDVFVVKLVRAVCIFLFYFHKCRKLTCKTGPFI